MRVWNKQKEKKREREKEEKNGLGKMEGFETFTQSLTHSQFQLTQNHFNHSSPNSPQNTSLSLCINTQTHPSLTHIYHTNNQPSISSTSIKFLPLSSFSLPKSHTQSPSPKTIISLLKSSKSISSSLLSHSSHSIQQCD